MRHVLVVALMAGCTPADPGTDTDSGTDSDIGTDTDAGTDTDTDTDLDTSTCDYVQLGDYAVDCGSDVPNRLLEYVSQSGDPSCPTRYELGTAAGTDAGAVLEAAGCDRTCVYAPYQAVMLEYCGARGEYITHLPGGPGQDGDGASCPDLLQVMTVMGAAWASSWEEYTAEHPCPPNEAPVLSGIEAAPVAWAIGGGPVVVTESLVVTDADDTDLVAATIAIDTGYQPGFDELRLTSRPVGIGAAWDSRSGTLTLSGSATVSAYEAALRTIVFDGSGEIGTNGSPRTVTFVVDDGEDRSNAVSRTVTIEAR